MARERTAPAWVWDGWYGNNPHAQRAAIQRFFQPVTTTAERAAVVTYKREPVLTFGCSSCGRFAFPSAQCCYWCRAKEAMP